MKSNPKVPNLPTRLLAWYCGKEEAEDILGDLEEVYLLNCQRMSRTRADLKYWMQSVGLLFSYAVARRKKKVKLKNPSHFHPGLLQNYFKTALRSLARQRSFTLINIICLATGMSVGLMSVSAFIDLKEVDDFHLRKNNIYRVITRATDHQDKATYASSSAPLSEFIETNATGVAEVVTIKKKFSSEAQFDNRSGVPLSGYYASANFFNVFDFKLAIGNASNALSHPSSIVLTSELSEKLFGLSDPLGKTIPTKDGDLIVTGVLEEFPRTHFWFESLVSLSTVETSTLVHPEKSADWGPRTSYYTYLLLTPNGSPDAIQSLLRTAPANFKGENIKEVTYDLQKLDQIPTTDYNNEVGLVWGYAGMGVFFALGLLVLLPACFNYSNISIARTLKRAKEIGLRKVAGGQTQNIFLQMVMETVVLSLISLAGGILIFVTVRQQFLNMIVGGSKAFDMELTPLTIGSFALFAIVVGIVAGIVPAAYFSKLNPIETLRNGSLSGRLSKVNVRKGLIIFQFSLSLVFILGVAILVKQYKYILNYNLGFQKENILEIPLKGVNPEVLVTELKRLNDVSSVSLASSMPGTWSTSAAWVSTAPGSDSTLVNQMFVDSHFLHCLEIPLVAGSDFPAVAPREEEDIIINETFLSAFEIGQAHEALDRVFYVDGRPLRIIGVVKDFNHMPLREKISPFFFRNDTDKFQFASVKVTSTDMTETLQKMQLVWDKVSPHPNFEAYFLDDQVEAAMISFRSLIKMFSFLGLMAITISCLGLLAVVISTSESRLKEMGVRKVFGASSASLAFVLSRGFLKLIGWAILLATPFTYLLFDKLFLRINHYRAAIGVTEMALGITLLLLLILVTIGGQTLRVARVNPVETLKHD